MPLSREEAESQGLDDRLGVAALNGASRGGSTATRASAFVTRGGQEGDSPRIDAQGRGGKTGCCDGSRRGGVLVLRPDTHLGP